jgi:glycerol uptake facilitator-like aquaporin
MVFKYVAEFLGSLVFFSVIAKYATRADGPFIIGLTLAIVVYFGIIFKAGHFNPVVSTIFRLAETMDVTDYISFVLLQFLAGVAVWVLWKEKLLA